MIAMLVYLAGLVEFGHTLGRIGTVRIGKTLYAAGEYATAELQQGSIRIPSERRIALSPLFSDDESLLPASYRRSREITYELDGQKWYIAGWHESERTVWLAELPSDSVRFGCKVMKAKVDWWPENYNDMIKMSSSELLSRA